ncbi:MAG: 2OG-Fe(II) oxygenase [Erythrobacter sp.]|jgi:prolyl 4-hydroxylase
MSLQHQVDHFLESGKNQAAVDLVAQCYSQREGEAAFVLANWAIMGLFVPRDIARARFLFQQAHEWGHGPAGPILAALLGNGAGGLPRDWSVAIRMLSNYAEADPFLAEQLRLIGVMAIDEIGDPVERLQHAVLSDQPRIVVFRQFLSSAECAAVIAMTRARLQPAVVVDPQTGQLVRDPVRDSQATAFPFIDEGPFLHAINRRIAVATGTIPAQGEPIQVLHYQSGQQYHLHSDALNHVHNQRILTFLVYLNEEYEGGATHFPAGNLSVRCGVGDAICFANVTANRRPDPIMRHAGMPVTSGEKFLLSRWIREHPLDLGVTSKPRS